MPRELLDEDGNPVGYMTPEEEEEDYQFLAEQLCDELPPAPPPSADALASWPDDEAIAF